MPAIKSHTTATIDTPWDGPLQKKNALSGKDAAYYGKIYAWKDPEGDETVKATYRFVHHEVAADGTPGAANTVGCSTGIGVLNGGMGGTTIPDADRQGVYDHLAKHIKDAGKEAPPLNKNKVKITDLMPTPNPEEGEGTFMMRCMNDPLMVKECPDENQRYDVCEALCGDSGMGDKLKENPKASFKGYEIKALNQTKDAEIWLYDEIGGGWFNEGISAKNFADGLNAMGKLNTITLRINSPGGDVFDGIAIYNILKQNPARIIVKIDGLAASIASVIAMAGDEIYMADNALMMIHEAWTMGMGNSGDFREIADHLDKVNGSILGTYAKKTKMEQQKIADMMGAETWMSAQEALDYGFVDTVGEALQMAAHFDMSKFKFKKSPPVSRAPMQPEITESDREAPMQPPDVSCFEQGILRCEAILNKE